MCCYIVTVETMSVWDITVSCGTASCLKKKRSTFGLL